MHSCNGLLLCFPDKTKLLSCVYNPSTNHFRLLPQSPNSKLIDYITGCKLVFDPTKSPHYKVVYAAVMHQRRDETHSSVEIKSYSSKTGSWTTYPIQFPDHLFSYFDQGVYFDGAIHWLEDDGDLHYKLDVDHVELTTIKHPETVHGKIYSHHKLLESPGCLLLAFNVYTSSTGSRQMNVYEMRNGSSQWSVKYFIDLDYFMNQISKPREMSRSRQFSLWCISVGEKEEDSFIVMEVVGEVFQYKILLKTASKIYDFIDTDRQPSSIHCFPFIPSLAGV